MSKNKSESLFLGLVLLLIGVAFLLNNIGIKIDIWYFFRKFWPTILIYIGLKNLFLYFQRSNKNE